MGGIVHIDSHSPTDPVNFKAIVYKAFSLNSKVVTHITKTTTKTSGGSKIVQTYDLYLTSPSLSTVKLHMTDKVLVDGFAKPVKSYDLTFQLHTVKAAS